MRMTREAWERGRAAALSQWGANDPRGAAAEVLRAIAAAPGSAEASGAGAALHAMAVELRGDPDAREISALRAELIQLWCSTRSGPLRQVVDGALVADGHVSRVVWKLACGHFAEDTPVGIGALADWHRAAPDGVPCRGCATGSR